MFFRCVRVRVLFVLRWPSILTHHPLFFYRCITMIAMQCLLGFRSHGTIFHDRAIAAGQFLVCGENVAEGRVPAALALSATRGQCTNGARVGGGPSGGYARRGEDRWVDAPTRR